MKVLKGKGTKMMGGLAFILSCAIPWFSADAGTVAWYRFNEGTLGARVDSSIVIENSANPGQLQGRCQQQMANGTLSTTDTGYMPMSVAGFPAGNGVVDPITRSKAANDRAFRFLTSKWGDSNEGGAGHYYVSKGDGACVTVPHDDRFHLSSFTVECFFRMDPIELSEGQVNDTSEQVLVCLPTGIGNGSYSFYLWIVNNLHRIHGGMLGLNNVRSNLDYKDVDFIDGKWHHVAVTFDGASRTMRLYLDYIKVKEATNVNAALPYYDSARRIPLMIGSDGTGYGRRFCGDIDEVRISDEALAVDALLRPAAYMPEIDAPSTVCHVTFDTAASDKFGFPLWKELNALPLDGAIKAEVKWDSVKGREPELDMSSLPAVDVYNATKSGNKAIRNSVSLHAPTNQPFYSASLFVDDRQDGVHTILNGSFTLEFFARIPARPIGVRNNSACIAFFGKSWTGGPLIMSVNQNGKLAFLLNDADTNTSMNDWDSAGAVCDNVWHHIAFTYDRPNKTAKAYLDRRLVRTFNPVNLDFAAVDSDGSRMLEIGSGYGPDGSYGFSAGPWIDEFRLSNVVLDRQDFLVNRRTHFGLSIGIK